MWWLAMSWWLAVATTLTVVAVPHFEPRQSQRVQYACASNPRVLSTCAFFEQLDQLLGESGDHLREFERRLMTFAPIGVCTTFE